MIPSVPPCVPLRTRYQIHQSCPSPATPPPVPIPAAKMGESVGRGIPLSIEDRQAVDLES